MTRILGIESSCDDTAVAIVENGGQILSNVTATQAIHRRFGGVVPELASRDHLRRIWTTVEAALDDAGLTIADIDYVAATHGPGLVGSLLVGVSFARGVGLAREIPTVAVNHLEAHIFVHRVHSAPAPGPFLALLVSGGHTELIRVNRIGDLTILGATRDDAAGEAFDKVGKVLGLGYPAGPEIDQLAEEGDPRAVSFPRARLGPASLDFSFSGLKTAVATHVASLPSPPVGETLRDISASFQQAVVDVLVEKTVAAAESEDLSTVVLAGGVAANRRLRADLAAALSSVGRTLVTSPIHLCTDNGVMVAVAGGLRVDAGLAEPVRNADPNLAL